MLAGRMIPLVTGWSTRLIHSIDVSCGAGQYDQRWHFDGERYCLVWMEDLVVMVITIFTAVGIACYADGCICHDRIRPARLPSVCPSVTFRCFVETNEATIMRFSPTGRTIILVSGEVKIVWKFARDHP